MGLRIAVWNCFAGAKDPTSDLALLAEPLKAVDVALHGELERFTTAARRLDQPGVIARTAGFAYVAIGKPIAQIGAAAVPPRPSTPIKLGLPVSTNARRCYSIDIVISRISGDSQSH
jgi:hypothetical protein